MHLALYRSERPESFNEIIGQKHIVKILKNQLKNGTLNQTYLFTGTRGTGKTTTARIIAKAVNCTADIPDEMKPCCQCESCRAIRDGSFLDVYELDAASNNGVDKIRELIDTTQYPPAFGKFKVYIIDEAHMLSASAANAFLKTLEEPPEYAMFILATTNPEKILPTIRSRCMTLDFKRVTEKELIEGIKAICDKRGINITDEALSAIASRADGSVRDGLSILEQCIAAGDDVLTLDLVLEYLGSAGTGFFLSLTDAVLKRDAASALMMVNGMIMEGKDARGILTDWLSHYRNLMVCKYVRTAGDIVNSSDENTARLSAQAAGLSPQELEATIRLLSEYVNQVRYSPYPRILLETAIIQLISGNMDPNNSNTIPLMSDAAMAAPRADFTTPRAERTGGAASQGTEYAAGTRGGMAGGTTSQGAEYAAGTYGGAANAQPKEPVSPPQDFRPEEGYWPEMDPSYAGLPADALFEEPAYMASSQPGYQSGSQPGNEGASQPGYQSAPQPGNQGASQQGYQNASQPGKQRTTQPRNAFEGRARRVGGGTGSVNAEARGSAGITETADRVAGRGAAGIAETAGRVAGRGSAGTAETAGGVASRETAGANEAVGGAATSGSAGARDAAGGMPGRASAAATGNIAGTSAGNATMTSNGGTRNNFGSLTATWNRITEEVSKEIPMFRIIGSKPVRYRNGELVVIIGKNKIAFADTYKASVEKIARRILSPETYITFREGDPKTAVTEEPNAPVEGFTEVAVNSLGSEMSGRENDSFGGGEGGKDEAVDVAKIAADVSSVLGVDVSVIE